MSAQLVREASVWQHQACRIWEYPSPYPPVGTICPDCGEPFQYPEWVTRKLADEHGNISPEAALAYEEFRGLFHVVALIAERDKGMTGEGKKVRPRDIDDELWEHAALRGWLEGQDERTVDLGLDV